MKPRGGPAGNPSVVLVQLDEATRQLQDLQEEAQQLAKVSVCSFVRTMIGLLHTQPGSST